MHEDDVKNHTPSILVADDDPSSRSAIQRVLERAGYRVEIVGDGIQALDLATETDFDLVISDLRMPGKTGLDLLSDLKDRKPNVRFVIISAYSDVDSSGLGERLGASDFIAKPFSRQKLIDTTARVLAL